MELEFRRHEFVDGLFRNPRIGRVPDDDALQPGTLLTWRSVPKEHVPDLLRVGLIVAADAEGVLVAWNPWKKDGRMERLLAEMRALAASHPFEVVLMARAPTV